MRQAKSFSTRIALAFVGLVLAGILLAELAWYAGIPGTSFHGAREATLFNATRSLGFSANQRVSALSAAVAERRGNLLVLAENDKLIKPLVRHDKAGLQKQLEIDATQLERAYPGAYNAIRVVDPASGLILASSLVSEIGTPFVQAHWLEKAVQPGVVELLEEAPNSQGSSLVVLRQLAAMDEEGYPIGVVGGVLVAELNIATMFASGTGNDRDGDRQAGVTLLLSDDERLLGRLPLGPEPDQAFWKINPQPSGFEGAMQLADGQGTQYLAIYRQIPLSSTKSVSLVHYQAVSEALIGLRSQLFGAMTAGVVLAMLAWIPLVFWARHLTLPLNRLVDAANRLGRGDLSARTAMKRGKSREVVELSKAFNQMADSLESNQRRLEQQVQEIKLTLEEKRALQARLVEAKEFAEAANRAKSTFLSNMSHELRTPLNAVLGFAQLLDLDRQLSPSSREKVAVINRAGLHLLGLIDEVLEISRIESGKSVITHSAFNLMDMLKSVEEMIQVRAEAKQLSFSIHHAPDLDGMVMGDEPHLKQVLINLMGNAVKYTDRGGVTVHVTRRGEQCVFEVADTGQGIREEDLERVFQPFYQTPEGLAKGEGSGLGLAISHHYARLMGGSIEVKSAFGKGSVFTLRLPLPQIGLQPVHENRQQALLQVPTHLKGMRVLVADDNSDNREVAQQLLTMAGFEVKAVSDGRMALSEFEYWQPQCVCMDMRMPNMDGYEATRQMRTMPGGDKVKILALTANAFEEDRAAMMAAGCDAVLRKPLEADKLLALVCELVGPTVSSKTNQPSNVQPSGQ